ncbi:MAG: hypothetical protein U0326_20380 [Polyangiales bacterium]
MTRPLLASLRRGGRASHHRRVAPSQPCTGVANALALRLRPGSCVRPFATMVLKPRQVVRGLAREFLVAESGPVWRHNLEGVSSLRPRPDGT